MSKIRCFIINLKRDEEKKKNIIRYLDLLDLDYEFIEGVDGNELSYNDLESKTDIQKTVSLLGRELSKGEIGCALSHISVYHKIVEYKIGVSLVLEDDVLFKHGDARKNLIIIRQLMIGRLNHVDCVLLGHHPRYSRLRNAVISLFDQTKVSASLQLGWFTEQPVGAYAYLITNKGAIKRIEEFDKINKPLDLWDLKNQNIMGVKKSIFKVDFELESNLDIDRLKTVYQRTIYQKIKDLIRNLLNKVRLDYVIFFIISNMSCFFKGLKKEG